MAPDDARASQGEAVAVPYAADSSEPLRTRQVSGMSPKPVPDTHLVVDEDREPEVVPELSEPTRVAPEELIETLREASRAEPIAEPLTPNEPLTPTELDPPYAVASAGREMRDEEDTLIFVLHEEDRRPSWIRKVVPLTGAAALTSFLALRAEHADTAAVAGKAQHGQEAQAPRVEPPPGVPTVVQLQPSAELAGQAEVDEPAEGEDTEVLTEESSEARRKWMRALGRGEARLAAEEYDSAVHSFERAIAYNPKDPRGYAGLAEAQLARGKGKEAVRALEKAIELAPEDALLRVNLARAYEQAGKRELADDSYHLAMDLDMSGSE